MSRWAYVNGRYVPHADAAIHIEDRGNQFSDAVYEVWGVQNGQLLDFDGHLKRLDRSLRELRIQRPMSDQALSNVVFEMVSRNRIKNGLVYLQISRGCARRDHVFPSATVPPSIMLTAKSLSPVVAARKADNGIKVITQPDIRWARRDIKTVSLLPNVLAKQAAAEQGAVECWMVDRDGQITEASSSNAWIITHEREIITRPANQDILNGITRRVISELAENEGLMVIERSFSVEEAYRAREAFVTSASAWLTPVIQIDEAVIGNGHPGDISTRLRNSYVASAKERSQSRQLRKPIRLLSGTRSAL